MSTELREIKISRTPGVELYRDVDGTERDVQEIMRLGTAVAEELGIGRIWMVSGSECATSEAEQIPSLCRLLSSAGVDSRWLVVDSDDEEALLAAETIGQHLYGAGESAPPLADHQEAFDRLSAQLAEALRGYAEPRDLVLVHGVLPMGMAAALDDPAWRRLVWVSHASSPANKEATRKAWELLQPMLDPYARCLFSEQRFAPSFLRDRCAVVTPGIDPLSPKNREIRPYELTEVLRAAGLIERPGRPARNPFERQVKVARNNTWKEEPISSQL